MENKIDSLQKECGNGVQCYEDIIRLIGKEEPFFYDNGIIEKLKTDTFSENKNILYYQDITKNENTIKKMIAMVALQNVADYLNGDWKPEFKSFSIKNYLIYYDYHINKFDYGFGNIIKDSNVYFKEKFPIETIIKLLPNGRDTLLEALGVFDV